VESYEIRYTTLARALLGTRLQAFEEQFRIEITDLMGEDSKMADLLFHSMEFADCLFVGSWRDEGWLLIDSAVEEESVVQSGPQKGQKIIVPRPADECSRSRRGGH
jgi:hypothetical protein